MLKPAGEIISESFRLPISNWEKIKPFMWLIFLPQLILSALSIVFLYLDQFFPPFSLTGNLIILLLVLAIQIVYYTWVYIAFAKTIFNILNNEQVEWKDTFKNSSHLIWPSIYSLVLANLIILFGAVLLIIPGIIFLVWFTFYSQAILFENKSGFNALKASKDLVVGRWFLIAWRTIVIGVIFGIINIILSLGLSFLIRSFNNFWPLNTFTATIASLIIFLVGLIPVMLSVVALIILYKDAKANPVGSELPIAPPKI